MVKSLRHATEPVGATSDVRDARVVCRYPWPAGPASDHCIIAVLCAIVHIVIPFVLSFEPGTSLCEQIVYAAKKAIISGQMRPGEPFPSVRTLSSSLKINPNTAHKVVTQLISEGLLAVHPGLGTVVTQPWPSSIRERSHLLKKELEQLVVEAKRLGLEVEDVTEAIVEHWDRLEEPAVAVRRKR